MSVFRRFSKRIGYYAVFGGICLIWLTGQNLQAFSLLGIEPKMFNKKINEMRDSTQKQFSENEVKLTGLESRIDKVETNISAQAQVIAKVQAGYDRSQTAGRDITTTVYNDPKILQLIIGTLFAIIMFLLKDDIATRKWLQNVIESKENYKRKLEEGGKL